MNADETRGLRKLILDENAVQDARVDAAEEMGLADAFLFEAILGQKRFLIALLTEIKAQVVGEPNKPTLYAVARELENCADLVRLHLDAPTPDFKAIEIHLRRALDAIKDAS